MTNHDESTQGETVADTPGPVRRPTRAVIALDAVLLGAMAGVLTWLVATYPEDPGWFDRLGLLAYVLLTGLYLWTLVKMLRKRWAKAPVAVSTPPTGYLDRDGERWRSLADGTLWLATSPAGRHRDGIPMDIVARDWGPLTPIHD